MPQYPQSTECAAFCCSSLSWGVGVSPRRWVLWFLFSGFGSSTLGVLLLQSQNLDSCARLHVSGTSCFHDRSVLQGCAFILLSCMACATSFCFLCRVLCQLATCVAYRIFISDWGLGLRISYRFGSWFGDMGLASSCCNIHQLVQHEHTHCRGPNP